MRRRRVTRGPARLAPDVLAFLRRELDFSDIRSPRVWGLAVSRDVLQAAFDCGGEAAAVAACLSGPTHMRRMLDEATR